MHIAASNPPYLRREDVPSDIVDKEREILAAQIADEGKPANVVEKIVEGRINKFFKENCLLEQPFVKEPKQTIEELTNAQVAVIGEKITIRRFARFALGEGLEKKEEDFGSKIESVKSSHPPNHEEKLSVRSDERTVIEARIKLLPPGIRKVMEEKFRADFVSIEEINSDLLI